ncbi:MAG TPA: cation transporter [Stellaceae bacterium]|nr:cation transporter [Stellaceae bacterium]
MARDPRISMEQQAEESSVQFALTVDLSLVSLLVAIGVLGGSLTLTAESIRATLMILVELFSFVVLKRIHRGELADLEFGTGKLEQVANTVIGAAMLGGALWIASRVIAVLTGESALGTPFGLALAAIAGALNLYANFLSWDRVRRTVRAESSIVMKGQLQSRRVKLMSSLFVLFTMTAAAVSTDDRVVAWADVLGSLFVAGFIVVNAFDMLSTGLIDLLDRSAGPAVHEAIDRALARHADNYGELARVRSRRSGRVIFIELALRFDPSLSIAQINQRIDALKQSLGHEIEHADISVLALTATR